MRTSTRQDWLAAGALLVGLAVTYAIPPAAAGANAARAFAAMTVAALVAFAVARSPFTFAPRIRTAFVLLVALALWYVATRAWAVDPAGSMLESSRVSAFVLMAWAAHTTVVGTAARRLLLGGIAAAALVVAAPEMWDVVRDGASSERVIGALGYWNATAAVSLCLVPFSVALAGSGRTRLIVLGSLLLPVAAAAAAATASRGALVALAIALVFQALLDPDHRGGLPRATVAAVAVGLIVTGLALDRMPEVVSLVAPTLAAIGGFGLVRARRRRRDAAPKLRVATEDSPSRVRRRLPRGVQLVGALLVTAVAVLVLVLGVDASDTKLPDRRTPEAARLASIDDSERVEWWKVGVDIWEEAPLHGQGGGAFSLQEYGPRGPLPDHVHSMPLEVLLETGVVGAALLLAATIQLLRVLRRGRRSADRALAGAIGALLISQSLVDWTFSLPQVLVLLALAGPLALQRPPDPEVGEDIVAPTWWAVAMLVSLAIATTVAFVPVLAVLINDQGVAKLDDRQPARAAQLFEQSMILVPSLETLTLQVVSLQAAGDDAAARRVLREHEPLWSTRLEGLRLAQPLLGDDPDYGPRIERRIDALDRARAEGELN